MTEIVVTNDDDKIYVDSSSQQIVAEEKDSTIIVETEAKKIVVEQVESNDIVVDVSNTYIITTQQPPDFFTPSNGQTIFTLSLIPVGTQIQTTRIYLNGQKLTYPSYTIAGSQLTINLPYDLETSDSLEVYY